MNHDNVISKTQSLCPICLKRIDAKIFSEGKNSYMKKHCPSHGDFLIAVWKGGIPMENWVRKKERAHIENAIATTERGCPFDCGLCSDHRQHTCTGLIEVTQNCNLHCSYCFANSYNCKEEDPSIEQIKFMYESLKKSAGACNIQLSGGEPTIRDDLPLIIKTGVDLGFNFIQVNTNGIRISEDEEFVKRLKDAGLSSIFLQFDGMDDLVYKKLRGRNLLEIKMKTIENCRKYGIGVVLVPTLVPKVNIDNIGKIIDFALENTPTVRGVHFQPVSYFGRIPFIPKDEDRITLPEVMEEIERQTEGKIKMESMTPPGCENALCSFHGSYIYEEKKKLVILTNNKSCGCSSGCDSKIERAEDGAKKAKEYVSKNWSYRNTYNLKEKSNKDESNSWDEILHSIHNNTFSISAMAFQDVWNVNLERVKDCCIHVVNPDGKLIPFCIYNITDTEGRSLYKNRK